MTNKVENNGEYNSKLSILNNKYAQINIDPKFLNKLRTFLSYKTEGIEFTPAFTIFPPNR
jgi:hypothetical protein